MSREKRNDRTRRAPIDPLSRARPADSAVQALDEISTAKYAESGRPRSSDLLAGVAEAPFHPDADLFQEEPTVNDRAPSDEPTVRDADPTTPLNAAPARKPPQPPSAPANGGIDVHVPVAPVQERQRPTQEQVAVSEVPPGDADEEATQAARHARRRRMATASYRGVAAKPGTQPEPKRNRKPLILASVLIILALGAIIALLSLR